MANWCSRRDKTIWLFWFTIQNFVRYAFVLYIFLFLAHNDKLITARDINFQGKNSYSFAFLVSYSHALAYLVDHYSYDQIGAFVALLHTGRRNNSYNKKESKENQTLMKNSGQNIGDQIGEKVFDRKQLAFLVTVELFFDNLVRGFSAFGFFVLTYYRHMHINVASNMPGTTRR